jgi:chemotaxis protein CheC
MIELHELEQDALTEIFNIGVGIAADALYQMVGEQVPLSVPVVELTSQREAKRHYLDREPRLLCAIRQTYTGEFTTDAVLMFPQESSDALVRMMVGSDLPAEQLAEMTTDALAELGNIVLNAVISNLASTLKLSLEGSLPDVSVISSEAIFTQRAGNNGVIDENAPVLALLIDFELSTQRASGYLAFLMDTPSSELLIGQLTRYVNAF